MKLSPDRIHTSQELSSDDRIDNGAEPLPAVFFSHGASLHYSRGTNIPAAVV